MDFGFPGLSPEQLVELQIDLGIGLLLDTLGDALGHDPHPVPHRVVDERDLVLPVVTTDVCPASCSPMNHPRSTAAGQSSSRKYTRLTPSPAPSVRG